MFKLNLLKIKWLNLKSSFMANWDVYFALLIIYFVWGSIYIAIRVGLESFPPFLMLGTRFLLAGGLLYYVLRRHGSLPPKKSEWLGSALIGILLLVAGNGGVAFAQQWVASSTAALGMATIPLWATLFAGLLGNWPNRIERIGLSFGLVGAVILNTDGKLWAEPLGAAALIVASLSFAFGSVLSRYITLPSGLMTSAAQMLIGGITLLCLGLFSGEQFLLLPSKASIIALAYLILVGSLLAFSAYTYLLKRVSSTLATSFTYVSPVIAVLLGLNFAGEELTSSMVISTFMIIIGVFLMSINSSSMKDNIV